MGHVRGKSLGSEQNRRVRAAARSLLPRYGSITALARRLGMTQAGLSSFLCGRTGAGFQLATALARELGVSLTELIDGSVVPLDRYPRRAAVLALLEADYDPEAVTRLRALDPPDPTATCAWWAERLQLEQRRLEIERKRPAGGR